MKFTDGILLYKTFLQVMNHSMIEVASRLQLFVNDPIHNISVKGFE